MSRLDEEGELQDEDLTEDQVLVPVPARNDRRRVGGPRVLVIADSDSRYKWAGLVAESLAPTAEVTACILRTRMMPSARQFAEQGFDHPRFTSSLEELCESASFMHYDVLVVAGIGSRVFRVIDALSQAMANEPAPDRRPLVVTGYVGISYEKHVDGLLWRIGSDVIGVNSEHDYDELTGHCRNLGISTEPFVRSGYVMAPLRGITDEPRPVREVLFAVQPGTPPSRDERLYLLGRLLEYSERFPERTVTVKLRAAPGETTTHADPHHYEAVYESMGYTGPGVLHFAYGRMDQVLQRTDLCITISSTAALEALSMGVPTAILSDFGVKELLGNHYFVGSGCVTSFSRLLKDEVPRVRLDWLRRHGFSDEDTMSNVGDRVRELLAQQDRSGGALPLQPPYYNSESAPYLYATFSRPNRRAAPPEEQAWKRAVKRRVRTALEDGKLRQQYDRLRAWSQGR